MGQKIEGVKDTRALISNFLQLFFNEKINFGPRSIIIQAKDEIKNIEPEDFEGLQGIVSTLGGADLLSPQEE